jgi:hypothetical protein
MSKRRNVTVTRAGDGWYHLNGIMGHEVRTFSTEDWRQLGLKPLRRGTTAVVDMQVSGVPKKRKG